MLAWTQGCGDEISGEALERQQRHIEVVAIIMAVKAEVLLTVGGVLAVNYVQQDEGRWRGITEDKNNRQTPMRFNRDRWWLPQLPGAKVSYR